MAAYIVTYDLSLPGRGYSNLYKRIRSFGKWAAITESSWMIVTDWSSVQVRDLLSPTIDSNDKLFVCGPVNQAAWIGMDNEVSDWLRDNIGSL